MTYSTESFVQEGVKHHQQGRFLEAERFYRQVLASEPNHPDALHLLGLIAMHFGKLPQAEELAAKAMQLSPKSAVYANSLGEIKRLNGRYSEAEQAFGLAIKLNKKYWEAHNNLGATLIDMKRIEDALEILRAALKFSPKNESLFVNIARCHQNLGEQTEAEFYLRKAIDLNPRNWQAWNNLCLIHLRTGKAESAVAAGKMACECAPVNWNASYSLGRALIASGKVAAAVNMLNTAIRQDPQQAEVIRELASLYIRLRSFENAELEITPEDESVLFQISIVKLHFAKFEVAESLLMKCLEKNRVDPSYWSLLGDIARNRGQIKDAKTFYIEAIKYCNESSYLSNYLFCLNYCDDLDPLFMRDEHIRLMTDFGESSRENVCNSKQRGRLKVGIVSADWRHHPVGQFSECVLRYINREKIELFCYSCTEFESERTRELAGLPEHWANVSLFDDEGLASLIRENEIDVLVDLAGHTGNNRLSSFARNPAPVQATYLGYPNTTGHDSIHFRITDNYADPIGLTDDHNTESLFRLPNCAWCFTPREGSPDCGEIPALSNEYITFGSFNNLSKISPMIIRIWVKLLLEYSNSILFLKAKSLGCKSVRKLLIRRFSELGISKNRLKLGYWEKEFDTHLDSYNHVDIALDSFPYHGTTTTCEALYMGVPVISLAGKTHVSRVGVSLLTNVGLPELVAESPETYIAKAVELADDQDRLIKLKAELRSMMRASPLMDGPRFAERFGEAMEGMWDLKCSQKAIDRANE